MYAGEPWFGLFELFNAFLMIDNSHKSDYSSSEKTYFPSYVRNIFGVNICNKYHGIQGMMFTANFGTIFILRHVFYPEKWYFQPKKPLVLLAQMNVRKKRAFLKRICMQDRSSGPGLFGRIRIRWRSTDTIRF